MLYAGVIRRAELSLRTSGDTGARNKSLCCLSFTCSEKWMFRQTRYQEGHGSVAIFGSLLRKMY